MHTVVVSLSSLCQLVEGAVSQVLCQALGLLRERRWFCSGGLHRLAGEHTSEWLPPVHCVSVGGLAGHAAVGRGWPNAAGEEPCLVSPCPASPVLHACPHRAASSPTRGPWDMFPPDPAPVVYAARAPSTLGCSHGSERSVTQGLSPHWRGQEPPGTRACWSQADNMLGKYLVTNVPSKEESRDLGVTEKRKVMKPRGAFPAAREPSRLRHTVPKTPWHVQRAGFSDRGWTDILPGLPTHVTRGLRVGGRVFKDIPCRSAPPALCLGNVPRHVVTETQ